MFLLTLGLLHVAGASARADEKDKIREEARKKNGYLQRWVLPNQPEVTLLRTHEGLQVRIKNDERETVRPLLEPQESEVLMQRCIERVKSFYPLVGDNFSVRFTPPNFTIHRTWDLTSGELSLVEQNGGLKFRFFAEKSRTISFLDDPVNHLTYFEIDEENKHLKDHHEEEERGYDPSRYLSEDGRRHDQELSLNGKFLQDLQFFDIHKVKTDNEDDYDAVQRYGEYSNYKKRVTTIKSIYFRAIEYPSKLDPKESVDRNNWSATIIVVQPKKGPPHAEILFEEITRWGHLFQIVHITAAYEKGACSKEGLPKISNYLTFEDVKFESKSKTWICPARRVRRLLRHVYKNRHKPVPFHMAGSSSFIPKLFSDKPLHSCITWIKDQVKILDIQLPDRISDIFYTHPKQFSE